ncbi:MAG: hypothetical protein LZF86_190122 [Nitrospira sp.]|nr:MAG: hypothetical protein LZF86_190122 [Nitrospira sp.]
MKCTRCEGLMVVDNLIDLQESGIPMWMRGLRCVSCGNIVDPMILRHRRSQKLGTMRLLKPGVLVPEFARQLKATA